MAPSNQPQWVQGAALPLWQRRWWLRTRSLPAIHYPDGSVGASAELYVPWWAWPLEALHRLVFGSVRIDA